MPSRSYDASIIVNAPAETIYDYIADFPRHVEWNHQPTAITAVTDGPVQVGSRFQTKEQLPSNLSMGEKVFLAMFMTFSKFMYGTADYSEAEITALEPHKRVAWKSSRSGRKGDLLRMNWEIQLEPHDSGTKVIQHCEIVPPDSSPFAKMLTGSRGDSMVSQQQGECILNLNRMKGLLEQQAAASPVSAQVPPSR